MLLVFFFAPFVMAFQISLYDYGRDLYQPDFVGWDNYQKLYHSAVFWQSMKNTLVFWLGVMPCMVVLPIVLAVLLNVRLKGIELFRALIYLPVIISMVVVGITWKWILATDGLLNYFLSLFGI